LSSRSPRSTVRPTRHVPDLRSIRVAAGVALLIALAMPAAAARSPKAMDPAAFAAELQRLSTILSSAPPGVVPDVPVPVVWSVEAAGQRVDMPSGRLQLELEAARRDPSSWPSRRTTLLAWLDALRHETTALSAAAASPATPSDVVETRATLARVLAGPEFKRMAQESAMSRLRERLSDWIVRMWDRLGGNRLASRSNTVVFAWIVALAALAVLTTWLVRLIRRPEFRAGLALTAPSVRTRSARAWAREARAAADPREAARYAYRAAVCRLEEEGAWRADEARTPREYLGLLPRDHRCHGLLADVTRRFEEIWYGAREATEEDRRSLLIRLEELGCLPSD